MSILSTESRALMFESLESLLISSGGRLRGCVGLSVFFRRKEVDFPRSDEALVKCRVLLLRCLASPEGVVGVAGEAGRTYFFVGEVDAVANLGGDFGGGGGGTEDLVGEGDSEY